MYKIKSNLDLNTEGFLESNKHYKTLLNEFYNIQRDIRKGGPEKNIEKHKQRGKLLARERIEYLIDNNTSFFELSALAAYNQYNNEFPSAGIITGIGVIEGIEAMIVANDATVKGGTYVKETIKKHLRAQEIALKNNLPCVYLVDSGGVFLPEQSNVFPDRFDFGRIFYNQSILSSRSIPQISIVMGSCTAGGAYVPAMSDEVIIVKEQGTIFIGGPPLVKAATGIEVTAEELGGGYVHTAISGVADHLANDDYHALDICRNIFQNLNPPEKQNLRIDKPEEPDYPIEELYSLLPLDTKTQVDAREILARILDGSYFHEFKKNYGKTLICGFGNIMGYKVGIIANNGVFFSETSLKGAHFIELCNYRKIPIIFMQNITGFVVGKDFEHKGIAKDGAKLVHAVATANVPKITIIWGGSYGAGNYAMCGRAYDPNFLFMYPNSKISVMGGEQAKSVLTQVKSKNNEDLIKRYEFESSAYYSTSRLWDDGIIDPAYTREIIALSISVSLNKKIDKPKNGIYRM